MIDAKAARNDPDRYRAALARKGAAEQFDTWLAADERWRELVPRVDGLRGRQKLQGKPSPEQVELGVLRRRLERTQADLETARRVIEVQGNVSALLEELLAKGASETNDGQP